MIICGSLRHTTSGRKKKPLPRKKSTKTAFQEYKPTTPSYRRETPEYKSYSGTSGSTAKVEPTQYTGTLVKGIGVMHKSNLVPIINEEQMKDIARMRR